VEKMRKAYPPNFGAAALAAGIGLYAAVLL